MRTYQMHTYQIEPAFTTARGTLVDEWPDLELSWHAYAHYKRQYYETSKARDARQRAEDPDFDEKNRRSEATFLELHPEWANIPIVEFTPEMPRFPEEWQYEPAVHDVRVISPGLSVTVRSRFGGTDLVATSNHVVNHATSGVCRTRNCSPRGPLRSATVATHAMTWTVAAVQATAWNR